LELAGIFQTGKDVRILIREAHIGDAEAIAFLLRQMGHQASGEDVVERLSGLIGSVRDRVWVGEQDERVIAFLSFTMWPRFYAGGYQGRISAMAVNSEYRRNGYGRQLVEYAEEFAKISDCPRIEVTSYSHRTETHEFYQEIGYTRVKSKRFLKAIEGDLS
jgi:N-acetylglutamate synthase-like GNAT family acetyltransferase